MDGTRRGHGLRGAALAMPLLLAACASTVPKPEFDHAVAAQYRIDGDDQPRVRVDAAAGVKLLPVDEERIAETIKAEVDELRAKNPPNGDPRKCDIDVSITRYQRGNAFARAMLAGLGQIHIEGTVTATDAADHKVLDEFKIAKTFAWGGIYGAATSMQDIERTFADGVAAALTGQEAKAKPAPKKEIKDPANGS
jgi:Domain of unknown function (DUF4410)